MQESTGLTFNQVGITRLRRLFSCSTISLPFAETWNRENAERTMRYLGKFERSFEFRWKLKIVDLWGGGDNVCKDDSHIRECSVIFSKCVLCTSLLSKLFFFVWIFFSFLGKQKKVFFQSVSRAMYSDKIINSFVIRSREKNHVLIYQWIYTVPKFFTNFCSLQFWKILRFEDLKSSNKITKFWFRKDFQVQTVLISKGF